MASHDHHPAVSRRTVVILAGTALVAAAAPAALFLSEPHGGDVPAGDFVALLADPDGAAELGEIWFEEQKPGTTLSVYEVRVADRLRAHGWAPRMPLDAAHLALAATVRADYAAGRMVPIREWQVSETEADLCALAALVKRAKSPEA